MFILKKGVQGFTVIDGPMAGRSYQSGVAYEEIPPQESAKFENIEDAKPAQEAAKTVASASKNKEDK